MRIASVPQVIPAPNRILAIGDLHGDREIFIGILLAAKLLEYSKDNKVLEWIGGDTVVVVMGDTVDSKRVDVKPDPDFKNKPMELQLQIDIPYFDFHARKYGGRVLSILGNHDIFASDAQFSQYVKKADSKSYTSGRKTWFTPGQGFSKMFGQTRNVVQIVGSYLFVHGSLVPEIFELVPGEHGLDRISYMNRTMKDYLTGKASKMPKWFERASELGINPMETRRYALPFLPTDRRQRRNILTEARSVTRVFPNTKYMVLGHTICEHVSKEGSVICTDVGLSRAFGAKETVWAEYLEIKKDVPYRVTMYTNGKIKSVQL